MNIFNLLKNTRGAIKARNALLIAGAAGAVESRNSGKIRERSRRSTLRGARKESRRG